MGLSSPQIIKTILDLRGDETPVLNYDLEWILNTLLSGEMDLQGLIPWSSNYTFLVTLTKTVGLVDFLAIYKPCQGERPLWDFPDGTLCQREFASYLVSRALGWPHIPPTVLRNDGCPHGQGSVQFFIDAEREAHYFNMRHISIFTEDFMKVALFDYIINNADRKGGHCLRDKSKIIWAIDHGLTFHIQHKLRTVIWEFCEKIIPPQLLVDLERLQHLLVEPSDLYQLLEQLISKPELQAFKDRLAVIITSGHFPELKSGRNVPYPPI